MLRSLGLVKLLAICAAPLTGLLRMFQSLLDLTQDGNGQPEPNDSVEHIEALIAAGAEEGILEEEDRKLIHSVVAFGDKTVRDVMTARPNIVAIAIDRSVEDLRQLVIHEQYSRIPVYEESIDNIVGSFTFATFSSLIPTGVKEKPLRELIAHSAGAGN